MFIRNLAVLALMLLAASTSLAATISVPLDQPTIQDAIESAVAGDEVFIANGTYNEPITLKSDVVLRGESAEGVVLLNPGPQYVIYAANITGASVSSLTLQNELDTWTIGAYLQYSPVDFNDVIVRGFSNGLFYRGSIGSSTQLGVIPALTPTISDSLFENNGTGIYFRNGVNGYVSGSTFQGNTGSAIYNEDFCSSIITDNTFSGNGIGINAFDDSLPLIENNQIIGNSTGISTAWRSRALIRKNVISANTLNGISTYSMSSPIMISNIISNNVNEGVWVFYNFPQFFNNTIVGNGANGVRSEWYAAPYFKNNIIAFNGAWGISDSFDHYPNNPGYLGRGTIDHADVFGNLAGDIAPNIGQTTAILSIDPQFRDYAGGNLQLSSTSACIDAGDPNPYYNDLDGSRNDLGAFGGQHALPGSAPTPEEIADEAQSLIIVLPDDAFKNEDTGRKEALEVKLDEIIQLINQAESETDPVLQETLLSDALNKLKNDLLKKCDGYFGGKLSNDWITTYEAQSAIYPILVDLINEVEILLAL